MNDFGIGHGVWEHFTLQDGLPDLKIESIYQDRSGRVWIGTQRRGVVRYDGCAFTELERGEGLAGNGVFGIAEDDAGRIWLATNAGLSCLDGDRFVPVQQEDGLRYLWGSCKDEDGSLWFGLDRRPGQPGALAHCRDGAAQLVPLDGPLQPDGTSVHCIHQDADGRLWVGGEGLFCRRDDGSFAQVRSAAEVGVVNSILSAAEGAIVLASHTGLWRCAGEDLSRLAERSDIVRLLPAGGSACWVLTAGGDLALFDEDRFEPVYSFHATMTGPAAVDSCGRLWLSAYGLGLYCYDDSRFRIYKDRHGLPSSQVNCLTRTPSGTLWLGTQAGPARFDKTVEARPDGLEALQDREVTALLATADGSLRIGTRNGCIATYRDGRLADDPIVLPKATRVSHILAGPDGRLWFGSGPGQGFGVCDGSEVTLYDDPTAGSYPCWIGAMAIDAQGTVWLGSAAPDRWSGLCRLAAGAVETVETPPLGRVQALLAEDERLWIGTDDGLYFLDSATPSRQPQKFPGLGRHIVRSLYRTAAGVLWIGTEGRGAFCFDGRVLQQLHWDAEPGCNIVHQLLADDDGVLWLATEGGLMRYTPRQNPPSVELTSVVAGQTYGPEEDIAFPTSVGRVRLNFAGRSLQEHPDRIVYRYRLEGLDDEWRQTRQSFADYDRLPPGPYTFHLQAVDGDLQYSDTIERSFTVGEDPRIKALNDALSTETSRGRFIGKSRAFKKVSRQLQEVSWTDMTVLILGETGTGKGLAARAIHELSDRKDKPFIHVNCGALPPGLVDSEIFGHEKGAFTGAIARKLGRFELADGGSIFLDEIGDLPEESQVRLLRTIEEKEIERVGGSQTIRLDVRVIAATNRDLTEAVREGRFRKDLYFRLNVFPVRLPPLRRRKVDIPVLTEHFVRRYAAHLNRPVPYLGSNVIELLMEYDWPGNVRELEHTLERAVLLAGRDEVMPHHITLGPVGQEEEEAWDGAWEEEEEETPDRRGIGEPPDRIGQLPILPFEEFERRYIIRVLEHTKGVIHGAHGAALLLNIKPTTLRSRMERLGITKADFDISDN